MTTCHPHLKEKIIRQQPGLVFLGFSSQAGDAVVPEGLRVLVHLAGVGRRAPLRRRGGRRAAARGTLRLQLGELCQDWYGLVKCFGL